MVCLGQTHRLIRSSNVSLLRDEKLSPFYNVLFEKLKVCSDKLSKARDDIFSTWVFKTVVIGDGVRR